MHCGTLKRLQPRCWTSLIGWRLWPHKWNATTTYHTSTNYKKNRVEIQIHGCTHVKKCRFWCWSFLTGKRLHYSHGFLKSVHFPIKCTANTTPYVCMREKFKFDVSSMHCCLVLCNHPGRWSSLIGGRPQWAEKWVCCTTAKDHWVILQQCQAIWCQVTQYNKMHHMLCYCIWFFLHACQAIWWPVTQYHTVLLKIQQNSSKIVKV